MHCSAGPLMFMLFAVTNINYASVCRAHDCNLANLLLFVLVYINICSQLCQLLLEYIVLKQFHPNKIKVIFWHSVIKRCRKTLSLTISRILMEIRLMQNSTSLVFVGPTYRLTGYYSTFIFKSFFGTLCRIVNKSYLFVLKAG